MKRDHVKTFMVDHGVPVVDEKGTGRHEVTGLDIGKRVVLKFVLIGGPGERGDLED